MAFYSQNYSLIIFIICECLVIASTAQSCRTLRLQYQTPRKRLTNHTIRTIKPITDLSSCTSECFMEPICSSINYCTTMEGKSWCDLVNTDEIRSAKYMESMDECMHYSSEGLCNSNPCSAHGKCSGDYLTETPRYKCICEQGYEGTKCEKDIDECAIETHDCHVTATCNNTIGGYNCTCKTGFHGNGSMCEDIDECATGYHNCPFNTRCTNVLGTFLCHCPITMPNQEWKVLFDFESGRLDGWNLTGTAFNNQPTYGDNSAYRDAGTSNLRGDWWIGTYENRPSNSNPSGAEQGDSPVGTASSPPFLICGNKLRFLIGGGNSDTTYAELLIDGKSIYKETSPTHTETMTQQIWDVQRFVGRIARVRLVDSSSGKWGHINFDHLEVFPLI